MHSRWAATLLAEKLRKPYVHVLFGARQTGQMDASPQFITKKKQGGVSGPPSSLKNEIGLSRHAGT